jgi:peptidoglycan/LPS O-acetylase OafA/YrhL
MSVAANTFAALTAATGWYYMFYSRAAGKLEGVEAAKINRRRVRLRRIGGGVMMLLGVLFFAGLQELSTVPYLAVWTGVLVLLLMIVALALIDLRLTWRLHNDRKQRPP